MNLSLNDAVIYYRNKLGMTQTKLAELCELSRSTIVNVEAGKTGRIVTLGVLAILREQLELVEAQGEQAVQVAP